MFATLSTTDDEQIEQGRHSDDAQPDHEQYGTADDRAHCDSHEARGQT